jgi:hypothetical protein
MIFTSENGTKESVEHSGIIDKSNYNYTKDLRNETIKLVFEVFLKE